MKARANPTIITGLIIALSIIITGLILSQTALRIKSLERTVVVKGLAEEEHIANIAIIPIVFIRADNDLATLYNDMEKDANTIKAFLVEHGFENSEISFSPPGITDKSAEQYGSTNQAALRYSAQQIATLYTNKIEKVIALLPELSHLGQRGIVISGSYQSRPQFLFTQLNKYKPGMIAKATRNARLTAKKFAKDSNSQLGKIKNAKQGQFSITERDQSNPQIKKVRVVTTIEYYLTN